MVKYEEIYTVKEMPDGKFAVLEYSEPGRPVLDGLTKPQAERLVEYLLKLLNSFDKLNK
jgi:hypothetical protein